MISEIDKIISSLENVSDLIKNGKLNKNTLKDLREISKQIKKLRKEVTN